jgi:hypothetical protein
MALSPKEREKIVEEETLKFETRTNLHSQRCAGRHAGRKSWLWFLAFFLLGYAVHGMCQRACPWGGDGMIPAHCRMGAGMLPPPDGQDSADQGQAPSAPAK